MERKHEIYKIALGALLQNPNVTKAVFDKYAEDEHILEMFANRMVTLADQIATKSVQVKFEKDGESNKKSFDDLQD